MVNENGGKLFVQLAIIIRLPTTYINKNPFYSYSINSSFPPNVFITTTSLIERTLMPAMKSCFKYL